MTNLRTEARGRECQIRIPDVCCHDPDTVVLCHLPNRALGSKSHNLHGAYGCHTCHSVVDGRAPSEHTKDTIRLWFLEAVIRTQEILLAEGKISV